MTPPTDEPGASLPLEAALDAKLGYGDALPQARPAVPRRLPEPPEIVQALRGMPLFETLSEDQLAWLAERGGQVSVEGGVRLLSEGEPAEAFYVNIQGELQITKVVGGHELVVVTSESPGAWVGQIPGMPGGDDSMISARVLRRSRLFRIPIDVVQEMLARGFPILTHLVAGISSGTRRFEAMVGQHEKLQALGKLAGGLAHELNNPASAARRAAAQLGRAVSDQQAAVIQLAEVAREAGLDGRAGGQVSPGRGHLASAARTPGARGRRARRYAARRRLASPGDPRA